MGLRVFFYTQETRVLSTLKLIAKLDRSKCRISSSAFRKKRRGGRARRNARHRPNYAPSRLTPVGSPEAHVEVLCRRRRRRSNGLKLWGRARHGSRANRRYITARVTLQLARIKLTLFILSRVHISRVVILLLRQRPSFEEEGRGGGAAFLGELQRAPVRSREQRRVAGLRAARTNDTEH